jgi:hypothetical protein
LGRSLSIGFASVLSHIRPARRQVEANLGTDIKRLIVGLLCVGLLALGVLWHKRSEAHQELQERENERQQAETIVAARRAIAAKIKQTEQSVAQMVSAHNAVTDWTDAFGGERFANRLPNDELVTVLARRDGRPVLVFGSVVDVIAQDDRCKLEVDAKANLISNIRLWLRCTPAQVKEALSRREKAYEEALEEIREEDGDLGEETPTQKQHDDRRAERMARQGYAVIARVDTVHPEDAETDDDPPAKAQFTIAEGRCLDLIYVGRGYSTRDGDEAFLRLNASEDERKARLEMEVRKQLRIATQEFHKKGKQ